MGYADLVLRDAPIAYYPMDETTGTVAKNAVKPSENGTYGGGITLNQGGPLAGGGGAPAFNGSATGIVTCPSGAWFSTIASFAYEALVYPTTYPAAYGHIIAVGAAGDYLGLFLRSTHLLDIYSTAASPSDGLSTTGIALNAWTHVGFDWDTAGSNTHFYVNGVAEAVSPSNWGGSGAWTPNTGLRNFGSDAIAEHFTGRIAHVAVYDKLLGEKVFTRHYREAARGGVILG